MGIVEGSCKYRARGVSIRGNEPRRRVPGAPSSDTPRERQANFRGSCGYRARGISIRGKFVLSRNLGYKTGGGVATLLKVVLTPGESTLMSNFRKGI